MIKKYFKFKMYSNYFYSIPQIVLTIVLFFFSFEYNHYSKSLGLTTKSTEPLYTFLFHFVRNGNVISVTLDLACAVFFLMQCRKEKLVHIGFFIFYSLYDIMGIFYATYPIPFLGLILHIAYIKLLSDDVSINCNALIIYSCIFGAMKQIPYFFFMFCDITQQNPSVELMLWYSILEMITGIYDVLIFKKLFSQYREEPVCDSVPEPINIAEQSGGSDTY